MDGNEILSGSKKHPNSSLPTTTHFRIIIYPKSSIRLLNAFRVTRARAPSILIGAENLRTFYSYFYKVLVSFRLLYYRIETMDLSPKIN